MRIYCAFGLRFNLGSFRLSDNWIDFNFVSLNPEVLWMLVLDGRVLPITSQMMLDWSECWLSDERRAVLHRADQMILRSFPTTQGEWPCSGTAEWNPAVHAPWSVRGSTAAVGMQDDWPCYEEQNELKGLTTITVLVFTQ